MFINNKFYCDSRCDSLTNMPVYKPINSICLHFEQPRIVFDNFSNELETSSYTPQIKNGAKFNFTITINQQKFFYNPIIADTIIVNKDNLEKFNPYLKQWIIFSKIGGNEKL